MRKQHKQTKELNMNYTEVYSSEKELSKLVSKLKQKNFERLSICPWSQIWENPSTDERVTLVFAKENI